MTLPVAKENIRARFDAVRDVKDFSVADLHRYRGETDLCEAVTMHMTLPHIMRFISTPPSQDVTLIDSSKSAFMNEFLLGSAVTEGAKPYPVKFVS